MRIRCRSLILLVSTLLVLPHVFADSVSLEKGTTATSIRPFSPAGVLCLVGGGSIPKEVREGFARAGRAGDAESCLVIIPTASSYSDSRPDDYFKEPWLESGFAKILVVHTRDRTIADSSDFVALINQASAIWINGGQQSRLSDVYAGTATERAIRRRLDEGAAVGGTSAGAAIASSVMIAGGRLEPRMSSGLDLLPMAIVDQHFSERQRIQRLQAAVAEHPDRVGIGIDESTAAFFSKRRLEVAGKGNVHLVYAATEHAEAKTVSLSPGQPDLDWTTLVRTAKERSFEPFPPPGIHVPFVEKGSLLIVGGGARHDEIWATFMEAAGGSKARIIVLPTASENPGRPSSEAKTFLDLGAEEVMVLKDTDPETVRSSEFQDKLSGATGIWFGGGRQWRFVDAYEGTGAVLAMRRCLENGGIIGGSSAGASIQGELLLRGAPVGNHIMVQDGYRRGFGFLPGTAIDQHFTERNRMADLKKTSARFPSVLSIGIDESTAILVQRHQAKVIGGGNVFVYRGPDQSKKFEPRDTIRLNRPFD